MKVILGLGLLSLSMVQSPTSAQRPSALEFTNLEVKERVLIPDNSNGPDIPNTVTNPNPNAGRPNRPESETERIERTTNQRIQNMHAIENAKLEAAKNNKPLSVYESKAEIKNSSQKNITLFEWAYRASPALQFTQDEQFLCRVVLKPGEVKKISALSQAPDHSVVNVSAGAASKPARPTVGDIIVNRIEFADGTTWQRPEWDSIILATRAAQTMPKGKCGPL